MGGTIYDQRPYDHMFLLEAMNAGCLRVASQYVQRPARDGYACKDHVPLVYWSIILFSCFDISTHMFPLVSFRLIWFLITVFSISEFEKYGKKNMEKSDAVQYIFFFVFCILGEIHYSVLGAYGSYY